MNRFFSRTQLAVGLASIASFMMGLAAEVISDLLPVKNTYTLIALVIIASLIWFVALRFSVRTRLIQAVMRPPITLRHPHERQKYARRGVIVFVSLYNPFKSETAKQLTFDERFQAAKSLDYEKLDLENSNLQTAIEAITSHADRIEHCWLVSTTAPEGEQTSSLPYVPVLIRYLREVKELNCSFHGGDAYAVSMDDDALVAVKTRDVIEFIFGEAEKLGLTNNDVVADFTGCPRSMTLGMILACLDGSRDIQFEGTHYDERGRPVGDIFPILFDFEAQIVEER